MTAFFGFLAVCCLWLGFFAPPLWLFMILFFFLAMLCEMPGRTVTVHSRPLSDESVRKRKIIGWLGILALIIMAMFPHAMQ